MSRTTTRVTSVSGSDARLVHVLDDYLATLQRGEQPDCSMLVAEHPELVSGLVLMSYPLHPPGKPQQLRVQHLPNLRVPTLFVHGTRDPFGNEEEMESALKLIPAKTAVLEVEGAGHDLNFKKEAGLPKRIVQAFTRLMQ